MTRKQPKKLAVGETWHVLLPKATQVACVQVDEITEHTVALRLTAEHGQGYDGVSVGRYVRSDVDFVERLRG